MEFVIQILILFIFLGTTLKLSFTSVWQRVGFGLLCGMFIILTYPYCIEQTKTGIAGYISNRPLRENAAILISVEAFIYISFCFSLFRSKDHPKLKWTKWFTGYYIGLLIFPSLFYLQTSLIFGFPGVDFKLVSWNFAFVVAFVIPLFTQLLIYMMPEKDLRLEVFFLVSLFIFILGVITTVDEKINYAPAKTNLSLKAIGISAAIFLFFFLIGRYTYLFRRLFRNK